MFDNLDAIVNSNSVESVSIANKSNLNTREYYSGGIARVVVFYNFCNFSVNYVPSTLCSPLGMPT